MSFQKRNVIKIIPGTKSSVHNGQLITSCGNPSLDHILGGGLPIGSLMLIEEDKFVTHSKVLTKYFLAEGIFSFQPILFGTLDEIPEEFLKKIPKPVVNKEEDPLKSVSGSENADMRIAWRYNELPKVNSEQSIVNIGHHFNLTEQINEETLQNADIYCWPDFENETNEKNMFQNQKYFNFLLNLQKIIKCDKFSNTDENNCEKSILRICISSLGSPLWYEENFNQDVIKFLTILKSLVRNSYSICFLTIPMKLLSVLDETLIPRIRNLVDFSFELESFAGSDKETNPAFKEYNGIFHIRKINALNTLNAYKPETTDLAFKLRRKKFVIEKLHLPPELQDAEQSDEIVPSLGCGSTTKNLLDF